MNETLDTTDVTEEPIENAEPEIIHLPQEAFQAPEQIGDTATNVLFEQLLPPYIRVLDHISTLLEADDWDGAVKTGLLGSIMTLQTGIHTQTETLQQSNKPVPSELTAASEWCTEVDRTYRFTESLMNRSALESSPGADPRHPRVITNKDQADSIDVLRGTMRNLIFILRAQEQPAIDLPATPITVTSSPVAMAA